MSEGFDEILTDSSPRVRNLATRTRALIRDVMPDVVEVPWPRQRVVGYGVGPRKTSEHFCHITFQKPHKPRFQPRHRAPRPGGVATGHGKLLRHVKLIAPENLSNPALRRLLKAAATHRMPAKLPS